VDELKNLITSLQNPRIKALLRLEKRRERDHSGLFVIEGDREISRAMRGGVAIVELYACPSLAAGIGERGITGELERSGIPVTSVAPKVFERLAYRGTTGGLVAVARKPAFDISALPAGEDSLYLVVERIEKPGNLGALLRSADGAGVTGLIVSDPRTDLCNPNVIRSSIGTVFTVPAAVSETGAAIAWLKSRRVSIIVTSPHERACYTEVDFRGRCAVVVGSEEAGVGESWLAAADRAVGIPMRGAADSLNVSAAAAVILYEALRQRTPRTT
jgi:TrmH family RNA methyltransferase